MSMLKSVTQTVPCMGGCGKSQPLSKKSACDECQDRDALRKAEKQAEQAKRGTFGDEAHAAAIIAAAEVEIARARLMCGAAPRSDPR